MTASAEAPAAPAPARTRRAPDGDDPIDDLRAAFATADVREEPAATPDDAAFDVSANGFPAATTAAPTVRPGHPSILEEVQTRLVVTGLTSVAGISAFKAALGKTAGVGSVSVASGAKDDFVFSVMHDAALDLRRRVPAFHGFAAQLTLDDGAVLAFTVTEPA